MTAPCPPWCVREHDTAMELVIGVREHASRPVVVGTGNGCARVELTRADEIDGPAGRTSVYLAVERGGDDMTLCDTARLAELLLEAVATATNGRAVVAVPPAMVHTTTARVLHRRRRP